MTLAIIFLFLIPIKNIEFNFEYSKFTYPNPIPSFIVGDIVPDVTTPISISLPSKII